MATIYLDNIEYVTLYTGDNGADFCTCNCPCCSQKGRNRHYQGTLDQAKEMFYKLPNLKQLYLFGNPDVTVDTDFCHYIMEEAINRNIHVCFSTSGVGGKNVLTKLLKNISTDMVDYISFSFDGITQQEMSFAKGISYPMEKALDGLNWARNNGYKIKVQPTLWLFNYKQTGEIIKFFINMGVNWFTFHIGSLEAEVDLPSHQHLTPEQIKEVHLQITKAVCNYKYVKVRCPIIYEECGLPDSKKWYCMHPERVKELLLMFTADGIKATHTPMASLYREDLAFVFDLKNMYDVPTIPESAICPLSEKLGHRHDTCCRYISRLWNY